MKFFVTAFAVLSLFFVVSCGNEPEPEPVGTESPDFVSFSDGKIPATWQTMAWVVDNTVGFDDFFSLKTTEYGAAVMTSKTCNSDINCIEFYVRNGTVNFFIDGVLAKECSVESNWTKHSLFLKEGLHTFKWENASYYGNVYIDAIRFKKANFAVGMPYQGGIIAYVDNSGEHGLIAAPNDQSEGIVWATVKNVTGAIGTSIGTGQSNTTKIIQALGNGNYAAKLCDNLVLNGYSDWFLPSKDELNEMLKNCHIIGGFNTVNGYYYWSSSELDKDYAWYQGAHYYNQDYGDKNFYTFIVRAVRAF